MKKVCLVISNISNCGGTEKMCLLLSSLLAQHNYDVTILSFGGDKTTYFEYDQKIIIHNLWPNKKGSYISFLHSKKLRNYFNKHLFDFVIICDLVHLNFVCDAINNHKTKIIVWNHFPYFINKQSKKRNLCLQNLNKKADALVLLTKADLDNYKNNEDTSNVEVHQIYNPLNIKPNIKVDYSKKSVVAVGRYTYQKGFDLLLNAWNIVEQNKSDWKLFIYGYTKKSELKKYKKIANKLKLNNVEFKQATTDIDQIYTSSSIYVMSSRFEEFPLTLIEASAYGLPLLSFDCKNGPNEIIEDGYNGCLVSNNNVEELANQILCLTYSKELRIKYGSNSQNSCNKFSCSYFLNQWNKILN